MMLDIMEIRFGLQEQLPNGHGFQFSLSNINHFGENKKVRNWYRGVFFFAYFQSST